MARKRRDRLEKGAEEFALSLMYEASGGSIGKERPVPEGTEKKEQNVSFSDRRALLDSIVKLIDKRHKMSEDDDPPEDGIEQFRGMLNGSAGGKSADRGDPGETALSDADDTSQSDDA